MFSRCPQDMSSRHLEDMSSRRLQDISSRRLEDVFSVTIFRLPRRLEDVLQVVFKTILIRLGRRKIVTLKTGWRRLQNMSPRPTNQPSKPWTISAWPIIRYKTYSKNPDNKKKTNNLMETNYQNSF